MTLRAYPVRYLPGEDELVWTGGLGVTVRFTPGVEPLTMADEVDLLVVTPEDFSESLQPLVEHKDSYGVATRLVTLEDVYGGVFFEVRGRDEAERVKYFIKDAVEEWGVRYVMLVGGRNGGLLEEKWWCPVRYAHLDDGSNWEASYLSDLYFADIYNPDGSFSSWDTNGNDLFAEYSLMSKDILDLYPDVYVGRLACRNSYEVEVMVDKIITYETTAHGSEWFHRMVAVGGDSAPRAGDPWYEGEEENKAALSYMDDFEEVTLWTSDGSLSGPQDVIDAVSRGCGFLFFDGHGNPMNWATHPPHDEETWIDGLGVGDMRKLSNDGMYPVCVVGGCHNGQFNVSLLNLLKIYEGYQHWYSYIYKGEVSPESWAWWITRMAGGGAIASLGYTGLDWFATGDGDQDGIPDCTQYLSGFMHVNFFWEYGENGRRMLGELHGETVADYINAFFPTTEKLDYKTAEEWALLGDPSLMVGGYP
ncbi:MAG TPA: peptidase C25 [Thermoplasmatales archaeon]|nr:peptidase C25 [Thermoplasmatales archaeon]